VPLFYVVANRTKGGIRTVIAVLALLSFALDIWLSLQAPKYAFFMMPPQITYPGAWALLPVVAAGLVIWGRASLSVLENRPMQVLGLISYSVYLWHWPLLLATRLYLLPPSLPVIAGLVAATLAMAWLSYAFIERPFRGSRTEFLRSAPRRAAAALAAVGLVCLPALLILGFQGLPGRVDPQIRQILRGTGYEGQFRDRTCFLGPDQGAEAFTPDCDQVPLQPPRRRLILWGDSSAAQLYSGLVAQPWAANYEIGQLTASLCPPFLHRAIDVRPHCEAIQAAALERIGKARPNTVILSALWPGYASVATDLVRLPAPEYLEQQMTQTVAALRARGVSEVIIVGPVPMWANNLPDLFFAFRNSNQTDPARLPNAGIAQSRTLDAALARVPGATYVNLTEHLCRDTACRVVVPGITGWKLMQFDEAHLTPAGSSWLARHLIGPALNEKVVEDRVLPGQAVGFSAGAEGVRYLGAGWMPPEGWGVWSSLRPATLFLPVGDDWTPSKLKLRFWGQLGNPPHTRERFRFEIKGDGPVTLEVTSAQPIVDVEIPVGPEARALARANGALVIEVEAPEARSPAEMGLNTDQRKLGFGLRQITLE
ncbi:MAG: acyltransferase family protein, partial [Nevskia sp.]|nr:acyltransferase family protein [Nevskia sp.]